MSATTQRAAILEWLQSGCALTALGALRKFGCNRLAARICELRKDGHVIDATTVRGEDGKRWSMYSMRVPPPAYVDDPGRLLDRAMPKEPFIENYWGNITGRYPE